MQFYTPVIYIERFNVTRVKDVSICKVRRSDDWQKANTQITTTNTKHNNLYILCTYYKII